MLTVGVIVALLLVACTSGDSSTDETTSTSTPPLSTSTTAAASPSTADPPVTTSTTKAPSGPGYGGVAIIADDQWPPSLNPWTEGGDNEIVSIIAQAWMTGAWDVDATTLELIPEAVTEIPRTSNGGVVVNDDGTMTVKYSIRDEATWEDGTPISGEDFAFTLQQSLAYEANQEFYSDYTDADVISTEVGPKTFSMTLRRPTINYESLFRWLLPHHAIEETAFPDDWLEDQWPGGGPFIVNTIEPNDRITLVRNEDYWKTDETTGMQLPYLDGIEFVFIPETEEIVRAFTRREVDVIQPPPWIDGTIEPLQSLEAEGADVQVRQGPVWEHINFQFGPGRLERSENSCNDNLALRRAVMHTIDRDSAIDTYYEGFNQALSSYVDVFSPTLSAHAWDRYPHDPATAQDLYQQAVTQTGVECSVVFSTTSNGDMRVALADMFVDMFAEAGIPFELELMDSALFFGEVLEIGTWDLGEWAWVASPGLSGLVSVHDLFDPNDPPPDGSNYYRWGTPDSSVQDDHTERFAEVVVEMNTTVDDVELKALIAEAEEILADQAVIFPLHARLRVGAVWADEIGGYQFNPSQAGHTWNIEQWYRTDR
jgi:peptide/nickel transport system substrate-binding protein